MPVGIGFTPETDRKKKDPEKDKQSKDALIVHEAPPGVTDRERVTFSIDRMSGHFQTATHATAHWQLRKHCLHCFFKAISFLRRLGVDGPRIAA